MESFLTPILRIPNLYLRISKKPRLSLNRLNKLSKLMLDLKFYSRFPKQVK